MIKKLILTSALLITVSGCNKSDDHQIGVMGGGMIGGGMMGGGMMSGGMMGQSSNIDQTASASVNPEHADALLGYIRKNNLPCTSCHSVSGGGVGPSFATVAANYAGHEDAANTLEDHIANGFGRMPGGLASKSEAAVLANMILGLAKPD